MKFFRRKRKTITVLEMDNHWLKIVQAGLSVSREKKIIRIVIKEISSLSDDAVTKIIGDLSRELKIDSRFLIISIPRHLTTIRNIER